MDLDPNEEPEQIMDLQDQSEPRIPEMDTNEGVGTQQDPMNALVIITSPDTQVTLPPKGSTNAPRRLEFVIGKRSVVSVTILLEDMVSKCLGKALKPKISKHRGCSMWMTQQDTRQLKWPRPFLGEMQIKPQRKILLWRK